MGTSSRYRVDRWDILHIWLPRLGLTYNIQWNVRCEQTYEFVKDKATLLQRGSSNHRGKGWKVPSAYVSWIRLDGDQVSNTNYPWGYRYATNAKPLHI